MPPLPGSQAIGGGTTSGAPATDQRGQPRTGTIDIGAFQSQGSTWVVNDASDGVGSAPGQLSLRQALNLANTLGTADTITFSSLFDNPQTITLTAGSLSLSDKATITIVGPGPNLLTVSGGGTTGVFDIEGGSLALAGLTISGGNAARGGGIFDHAGMLSLTDCTVSGNSATVGGGLYNSQGGATSMTSCTLSGNSARYSAGGLFNWGTATLTNCTLSSNNTGRSGGGLFNDQGGTATLTNCTVSGNTASGPGGGLYNDDGATNLTLTNCTVSANSSLYCGGLSNSGTAMLTNTIIAGNNGGDVSGSYTGGNDLVGGNALLAPLGDYGGPTQTMALLPGSPAIGMGKIADYPGSSTPITTDERGKMLDSVTPDIGAFQSQGFTLTPLGGSNPQSTMAGAAFANPLAVTVTANDPLEPVNGGVVNFAVATAAGGATATLSAATATVADGGAAVTATANLMLGSYTATARAAGAGQFGFSLTNTQAYSLLVNTTQDLPHETEGQNSLRAAIDYAETLTGPSAITFDASVFGMTPQTITLTGGQLVLNGAATITIAGPGANLLTVSGGGTTGVFDIEGASAALAGLTISGGNAPRGGGLYDHGATLSLTDCTVSGNSAGVGSGLFNSKGGTTSLTGCIVSGNAAVAGPGGGLLNYGTATLTECTISSNTAGAGQGGGLLNYGTATLTECTISGNTAGAGQGGGLANLGKATVLLTDCTVGANTAAGGGGLSNLGAATMTLANCTVSGNSAGTGGGGGLVNSNGFLSLTNCTVAGNTAGDGGGIVDGGFTPSLTLTDCTLSGNTAPTGSGGGLVIPSDGTTTLTNTIVAGNNGGDVSGGTPGGANNLIGGNPLLAALGDFGGPTFTMPPLPGSQAIGGGTTSGAPATDQRGQPRTGTIDIGAFQSQGTTWVVNDASDGVGSAPGQLSLRQALNLANSFGTADTITFSTLFDTPQTITLTAGPLSLSDKATTTIDGPGAKLLTLSGGGRSRVFVIEGASAALEGLTISGGSAGDDGGGLFNNDGTLGLSDATITGNVAAIDGGGVYTFSGTTSLTNCTLSGNSAGDTGGGLFNSPGGATSLTNCTLSGNSARYIAGGLLNQGTATLTNCTLSGNNAARDGGGLFNGEGGTATLTNCTVSGNSASGQGGGLFNNGGTTYLTLTNCTVSGNSAPDGGGLLNYGTATLTNTIVAGNTSVDLSGPISGSNNLIGGDLLLAPLGDYGGPTQTIALLPGSPAIGKGIIADYPGTSTPITTDQRGKKLDSPSPDIGAFQSQGFTLAPLDGSNPQSTMAGAAFANPLAVTVTANDPLEPVDGGVVNFAVATAAGGASATLSAATAMITSGQADVIATANVELGQYTANASAVGADQASFSLTNTQAYSLVVNTTEDRPLDTDGQNSLRAAINYADTLTGPSTITFDSAVFGTTPQTITLILGELTLSSTATITIVGPGANLLTVSGGGKSRVFDIEGGSAALAGLTISGGHVPGAYNLFGGGLFDNGGTVSLTDCNVSGNSAGDTGGGLWEYHGTMSLSDCIVSGNSAPVGGGLGEDDGTLSLTNCTLSGNSTSGSGGGMYNNNGTATLTNCTLSGNTATGGGGLFNTGTARTTLTDCTVSDNSAGDGGGLFNENTLILTDCTISDNSVGAGRGGGLSNYSAATLTDCTLSGNTAEDGGGLFNEGSAALTDCIVNGNTATGRGPGHGYGGGLFNLDMIALVDCTLSGNDAAKGGGLDNGGPTATATLTGCTVSANTAVGSGGVGNYGGGLANYSGNSLALTSTIVAGNGGGGGASDIGGPGIALGSYDLIGTGGSSGLFNGSDHNIVGIAAPMLGKLGNYGGPTQTIPLLPGSPAIGAGTTVGTQTTDQRGEKLDSPSPDIGAFQSQGFTLTPVTGSSPQTAAPGTAFKNPLAVTVKANNPVEPVDDGLITFTVASASGASATLLAATAVITGGSASAAPIAAVSATANDKAGSYSVTATAGGASSALFSLTNRQALASPDPIPTHGSTTTAHDVVLEIYNLASLRAAIAYANNHAGPATITFDSDTPGTKHRTIRLTGGPLVVTDPATTTIIGPGARLLTLSGGRKSRVFDIQGGSLALSGVTIADGKARLGGGILNDRGTLALDHVVLRGNRARVGGALYNDGAATLTDVIIRDNTTHSGSGLFSAREATLIWRGLTRPVSTRPIVVDHFKGKGGVPTNWKKFEGQPGDVVERPHNLTITDSTGDSAGITSTAKTVPFNPVGAKTTIGARINSVNSNGNAIFGLIDVNAQGSAAGYLTAGIDAHGNLFIAASIAQTLKPTPKLIGVVKDYNGRSITLTFTIRSTGVEVDGGGFKSGLILFKDLSNFSLAAAFPNGSARPALGALSQPGQNGGSASFGSIRVNELARIPH
jgi:CSLREA domain-containing protein